MCGSILRWSLFGRIVVCLSLLVLSVPLVHGAAADTCSTKFKSCEERDRWRLERFIQLREQHAKGVYYYEAELSGKRYGCTTAAATGASSIDTGCPAESPMAEEERIFKSFYCEARQWFSTASPSELADGRRAAFAEFAGDVVARVNGARGNDRLALLELGTDNGIPRGQMTPDDLRQAVSDFAAHVKKATSTMVGQAANKEAATKMKGWFDENVADQIKNDSDALNGFEKFYQEALGASAGPNTKGLDHALLVVAQRSDKGTFPNGMTPYYARMILQFWIVRKVKELHPSDATARLNAFAAKLQLKVNADESSVVWENFIPHDGYVFGATPAHSKALLAGDATAPSQSTGIDCSLLVQTSLQAYGYNAPSFVYRTSTVDLLEPGAIPGFSSERVCSEKDLNIGDVVVYGGHTYFFLGYSYSTPPKMLIIEATGGAKRTVRAADLDIYNGDSTCQSSSFTKKQHMVLRPIGEAR